MSKRGNITKFGREKVQRKALIKSLCTAVVSHGRIKTTTAKAKALTSQIEKLITLAKKQDLASQRLISQFLGATATKKLCSEIAPRFVAKKGGYTRIIGLGRRLSDGAEMTLVEFTA